MANSSKCDGRGETSDTTANDQEIDIQMRLLGLEVTVIPGVN